MITVHSRHKLVPTEEVKEFTTTSLLLAVIYSCLLSLTIPVYMYSVLSRPLLSFRLHINNA